MKKIIFITLFLSPSVWALNLKSTVSGISIGNTHQVTERILRGKAPDGKVSQLVKNKVTDIIIFKMQSAGEIDAEIKELKAYKYKEENIHYIPIQWKNLPPFKTSCEQTIQALQILKSVSEDPKRKAFFHCTAGQDRTGVLAGLWKMLLWGQSSDQVFKEEMCEHGYEGASPGKPDSVIRGVKEGLTKIFIKIAYLIEVKKLNIENLDSELCSYDFASDEDYLEFNSERVERLSCPLGGQ